MFGPRILGWVGVPQMCAQSRPAGTGEWDFEAAPMKQVSLSLSENHDNILCSLPRSLVCPPVLPVPLALSASPRLSPLPTPRVMHNNIMHA